MDWLVAVSVVAEGGSGLLREDWLMRIPVALGVLAVVVLVDGVVIARTIRGLRKRG